MKQRKYMIFGITGGIGTALGLKLKQQAHLVHGFGRDADRLQRVTSEACDGTQVVDMQDWQAVVWMEWRYASAACYSNQLI